MATHSSILAWEIPWTGEPGGLWSWGHKESEIIYIYIYTHGSLVAKLSPTLSSSVCGISQARILEYIYAIIYICIYTHIYIYNIAYNKSLSTYILGIFCKIIWKPD